MPRTHAPYAPEYRRRIIELARAERSINELAREFGRCLDGSGNLKEGMAVRLARFS